MTQLDWIVLARGALWIAGLGLALAAWSHATWSAGRADVRLGVVLGRSTFVIPFSIGIAAACAGFAWGAAARWEQALWGLLTLACLGQAAFAWRGRSR